MVSHLKRPKKWGPAKEAPPYGSPKIWSPNEREGPLGANYSPLRNSETLCLAKSGPGTLEKATTPIQE